MNKTQSRHTIDIVFVLSIACAFAASVLMVLTLGVNVYGNIEKASDAEFNNRVCLSYISAKIHMSDSYDDVSVDVFEGVPALYLDARFDDVPYNTIIYYYDGWLRELFCEKDLGLPLEAGTPVLEIKSLYFETIKPNLLYIEFTDKNDNSGKTFVNLRSERSEAA